MQELAGLLQNLVRELDRLGSSPSMVALVNALKNARLNSADLTPFVRHNPRSYNRARVVMRDAYELLVMTWQPGQGSVPHDHSGSTCAMQVVQGELTEGCYRIAADGYVDLEYESPVAAGDVAAGQDAGVHSVRNAGSEPAVSVHVYAPPLSDFRQFKLRPAPPYEISELPDGDVKTVVVVGGGFSGSMTAAQILLGAGERRRKIKVVLAERRGTVGEGIAYGTREPVHLLNVPAGRMSAWSDCPDDFVEWAKRRDANVKATDFLPRVWYGEYIRDALLSAVRETSDTTTFEVAFDEVRNISRHPSPGWMVHFARQASVHAAAVVLAVGHRPPSDPIGPRWTGPRTRFIADPWRPHAASVIDADDPVAIVGSGLTAVDTILSLTQRPRRAPIVVISRNGLLPQPHLAAPAPPVDLREWTARQINEGVRAKTLLTQLRRLISEHHDWRGVLDGLRPHTTQLWQAMPSRERRRVLTKLRQFWEIHRHRMAVAVADQVNDALARGDIKVIAGRIEEAVGADDRVDLRIRERRSGRFADFRCSWVINCTGPVTPNSAESNPAIGSLLVGGWLMPDELSLGVEATESGNAISAAGKTVADLFIVGTLRKPALWESTAVPELRIQAAMIAEHVVDQTLGQRKPQAFGIATPSSQKHTATH